jgi:hypothetical protein
MGLGPPMMLDKSTLQGLSWSEARLLNTYYYSSIAPILITEVLGDLSRPSGSGRRHVAGVPEIASKLPPSDCVINPIYWTMLWNEIAFASPIRTDGKPIRTDGTPLRAANGERIMFFDEQPDAEKLRRWRRAEFTEEERLAAAVWRAAKSSIDNNIISDLYPNPPRCTTLEEAHAEAVARVRTEKPDERLENILWLMRVLNYPEPAKTRALDEYMRRQMPPLEVFAPYSAFCLGVLLTFQFVIGNRLFGRQDDRIDLEYLFYLPFTKIFSSRDQFLVRLAPLFVTAEQEFVHGDVLKADLRAIRAFWKAQPEERRTEYRRRHGIYPPNLEDSFTLSAYKRWMGPRPTYAPGTSFEEWSEEKRTQLMEYMRPIMDALDRAPTRDRMQQSDQPPPAAAP